MRGGFYLKHVDADGMGAGTTQSAGCFMEAAPPEGRTGRVCWVRLVLGVQGEARAVQTEVQQLVQDSRQTRETFWS